MRKIVDEKLFFGVKKFLTGGVSVKETAEYFGLTPNTVRLIGSVESIDEYREAQTALHAKYRKPNAPEKPIDQPVPQLVEHKQTVTIQATHYMMEELKKQNDLLALISNKLAFIVEQLT